MVHESIIAKPYNSNNEIELQIETIDYEKDIAILTAIDENYSPSMNLRFGETCRLEIGDTLFAIGNLNNYGLCCNTGILSAQKKTIFNNNTYNEYYQTNIEISKGSSGGPVLNKDYEVVGIMTFKVRDLNSEYVDGMSFFIPIESVINSL